MRAYLDLLERVLVEGKLKHNRTGVPTFMVEGAMLQFDLSEGFPAVTTKKLAFNAVKGELIGFIRGVTSAADFRALGCNVWNANANENADWLKNPHRKGEDDLGRVYGAQWRDWICDGSSIHLDQLELALHKLIHQPDDRRNIVTAWNPGELHKMALPPCHMLFQLLADKGDGTVSMTMYQRSCDLFLGIPFNIASYALLLELICAATGYKPGKLIMFLADAHIYVNHMDQCMEQVKRQPYAPPKLGLDRASPSFKGKTKIDWLMAVEPHHIWLEGYECHPAIKGEMAV